MHIYYNAFWIALATALLLTPAVKSLARRIGALDKPDPRKVHTEPMPRLGGLAIYAGFCLAVVTTLGTQNRQLQGILVGGTLMLLLGAIDDFRPLRARVKFLGQILIAALVVIYFGVRIEWLTNPFRGMVYLGKLGIPLTILWIVAVVNTINLSDGLDGLAAGVSSIAAATLFLIAWKAGQLQVLVLTAALAGSTLGFLRYNFNPAKIFMGDSGSMSIGFILATIAVQGAMKSAATIAMAIPILALGLPIFDTSFAIVRRFLNGRPISEPDRGHLHHRLLEMGLSQRQAVMLMYLISVYLGFTAFVISVVDSSSAALVLAAVGLTFMVGAKMTNILVVRPGSKHYDG